jgi:lambda family phage tail tape measure protein
MAASIKVTLELDDKGYLTGIKAATAETNKLQSAATTGMASVGNSFGNASSKLEAFSGKMSNLVSLLLGAGFLEFGRRALSAADNVVDLSNATDVSIPKILQLKDAFQANGGSADGLSKVLSRLSNSLYDAREGGKQAQENLIKLGFSMKDIANLDTEGALQKTIDKLAGMTDPVERNALAFRIFGKEAKSIDWLGIKNGTSTSTEEYYKMAESQKRAAEAHDKLVAASEKLTIAFANLLDKTGVLKFINDMSTNMDKAEKAVTIAGIAFGTYFGAALAANILTIADKLKLLPAVLDAITAAGLRLQASGLIAALGKLALVIALALTPGDLNKGEDASLEKIKKFQDALGKLTKSQQEKFFTLTQNQQSEIKKLFDSGTQIEEAFAKIAGAGKKDKPPTTAYWEKDLVAIRQLTEAYQYNEQIATSRIAKITALVGAGENEVAIANATSEAIKRQNDAAKQLVDKRDLLLKTPQDAGRDAQIAEIGKQLRAVEEIGRTQYDNLVSNIKLNNEAIGVEKIRTALLNDQIALQDRLTNLQTESAKVGLTNIEKKYYDIEAAAKKAAEAEIRGEEQRRFGANAGQGSNFSLSEDEKKRINEAATTRAKAEKEQTQKTYEAQRTFSGGWKDAFNSYVENATNAAQQAQTIFQTVTKGLEDLIVNFVTTGKLNFKDLANTLIAEFVRIQAKKVIAGIFGGSGTSDFFASIVGKASGGPVNGMTPYLVGEQGPELFVPRSAGNIVPNGQLGGGASVTYNINAVDAASFRQMLAREPEFLYAVTEKGRSSIPAGRR